MKRQAETGHQDVQGGECKEKENRRVRRRRGLPVGKALRKLVCCGGYASSMADEIISNGKEVMAVDTYFSIPVLPGPPSQWCVKSSGQW